MCSLDWGIIKDILVALISAGIPSLVAWLIYRGWNNQKGTEVIALDAKEIIINLSKLQDLQNKIHDEIFLVAMGGQFDPIKRNEYEISFQKLSDSLNFINFAIKDNELSHYSSSVLAQAMLFKKYIDKYDMNNLNETAITMIDSSDALHLTNIVLNLALYKKI